VSFASPYPGKIIPVNLQQMGYRIICQKDAFLCAAKGVSVGIEFQKDWVPDYLVGKALLWKTRR